MGGCRLLVYVKGEDCVRVKMALEVLAVFEQDYVCKICQAKGIFFMFCQNSTPKCQQQHKNWLKTLFFLQIIQQILFQNILLIFFTFQTFHIIYSMFKYTNIYKTTSMFLTGKNKMCFFDSREYHLNNLIYVVTLSSCQSMCHDHDCAHFWTQSTRLLPTVR